MSIQLAAKGAGGISFKSGELGLTIFVDMLLSERSEVAGKGTGVTFHSFQ